MNLKKIVIFCTLSVALGVGIGWGTLQLFSENSSVIASDNNKLKPNKKYTIGEAINQVPFKIKKPKYLPFESKGEYAYVHEYSVDSKEIEINFVNSKVPVTVQYTVIEGEVIETPEREKTEVSLKDGTKAQFMDNGKAQFLYWYRDGLSHRLVGMYGPDTKKKFDSQEFTKIANSLE